MNQIFANLGGIQLAFFPLFFTANQMKYTFLFQILLILLFVNLACKDNVETPVENDPMPKDDFSDRTYELFVPGNADQNESLPLLFVFHGAYGTGAGMQRAAGFDQYAREYNFIVCYPDAATENWEEGCMCNKPYRLKIDDIGYINYLIDTLSSRYNINPQKIFAAGYSQGGLFAQNVACKISGRLKAVAAVASPMSIQLFQSCKPESSISILMIHGTSDSTLPYYGSDNGSFSLVSTPDVINLWGQLNNCNSELIIEHIPDNGDASISVTKNSYLDCRSSSEIVLFEVKGGGHRWFDSPDLHATETIVEFFFSK